MVFSVFSKKPRKVVGIKERGLGLVLNEEMRSTYNVKSSKRGDDKKPELSYFKKCRNAYRNCPEVHDSVEVCVALIVQEPSFEGPNSKKLEEFKDAHNLVLVAEDIQRTKMVDGGCYIEAVESDVSTAKEKLSIDRFKFLPTEGMTILRDPYGTTIGYAQEIGSDKYIVWGDMDQVKKYENLSKFHDAEQKGPMDRIMYFAHKKLPFEKEGRSHIEPSLPSVDRKLNLNDYKKTISERYSAPLIDAEVGNDENPPTEADIALVEDELEDLQRDSELVHSYLVKIKTIGFEGQTLPIQDYIDADSLEILRGMGIPPIALGITSANAGKDESQLRVWWPKLRAMQERLRRQIEDKLIVGLGLGTYKDHILFEIPEIREKEMEYDMLRGLVTDGIITAQKANDQLPSRLKEKLPEVAPQAAEPNQGFGADKIKNNPTDPTKSTNTPDGKRVDKNVRDVNPARKRGT